MFFGAESPFDYTTSLPTRIDRAYLNPLEFTTGQNVDSPMSTRVTRANSSILKDKATCTIDPYGGTALGSYTYLNYWLVYMD